MAISTYSELQTSGATWLDRTDLTARIPEFITLAESYLDTVLRARELISRATADLNEQFENLPRDFAEEIRLYVINTTPTIQLKAMSPAALVHQFPSATGGRPQAYAIVGPQIQFAPPPETTSTFTIELTYYSKLSAFALSDSNTSNVILAEHPDIYLYATLSEAAPFLMDERALQRFVALRDNAIARANSANQDASYGGVLQMQHGMRHIA